MTATTVAERLRGMSWRRHASATSAQHVAREAFHELRWPSGLRSHKALRRAVLPGSMLAESESENDDATEGVIGKARDPWSAPVRRSGSATECKNTTSMGLCSLLQELAAGIHQLAAAALPPSGSMPSSNGMAAPPHLITTAGCHRRIRTCLLHAAAAQAHTRHPVQAHSRLSGTEETSGT